MLKSKTSHFLGIPETGLSKCVFFNGLVSARSERPRGPSTDLAGVAVVGEVVENETPCTAIIRCLAAHLRRLKRLLLRGFELEADSKVMFKLSAFLPLISSATVGECSLDLMEASTGEKLTTLSSSAMMTSAIEGSWPSYSESTHFTSKGAPVRG